MKVTIEEVHRLYDRIAEINLVPLSELEIYKNDILLNLSPKVIEEVKLIGLTNTHIIFNDFYQE